MQFTPSVPKRQVVPVVSPSFSYTVDELSRANSKSFFKKTRAKLFSSSAPLGAGLASASSLMFTNGSTECRLPSNA